MYTIICGAGEVGRPILEALQAENHNIAVIDHDPVLIGEINTRYDVQAILGKASFPAVLERAGAKNADAIIVVTNDEEVNILCAQIAYTDFRIPVVMLRLSSSHQRSLTSYEDFIRRSVPDIRIINPERRVAKAITSTLGMPGAYFAKNLLDKEVCLIALRADEFCPILNSFLKHLTLIFPDLDMRIVAIWRDGAGIIPTDEDTVLEGDLVYFVVRAEHLDRAYSAFGKTIENNKRIVIIGGGKVSSSVVHDLLAMKEANYRITLFELRKDRARTLAERFPTIQVLQGDVLQASTPAQANIDFRHVDVTVTLTGNDEKNILATMMLQKLGCRFGYALVRNQAYSTLIDQLEIDGVMVPQYQTMAEILSLTRSVNTRDLTVLHDHFAEVIEIVLTPGCGAIGYPIGKLNLGRAIIVATLSPKGGLHFPFSSTLLEAGMTIVIVVERHGFAKLHHYFAPRTGSFL